MQIPFNGVGNTSNEREKRCSWFTVICGIKNRIQLTASKNGDHNHKNNVFCEFVRIYMDDCMYRVAATENLPLVNRKNKFQSFSVHCCSD